MIIGISGEARSGKDTFAAELCLHLNSNQDEQYSIVSIADEIKTRCLYDFNLSEDQLWGNLKDVPDERYEKQMYNNEYFTPREILQNYGNFFRSIDKQFWLKKLFENTNSENIIIADVRLKYEIDYIKDIKKGYHIKLIRENNKMKVSGKNDITETENKEMYRINQLVYNDGSLRKLLKTASLCGDVLLQEIL